MADWCPAMAAFLEGQGLPVNKPIHVVLDAQKDIPGPTTELFPHREIRLPMRAPGVLEDGYTEADPWRYFLFKGLGLLGIFNERSGLPARIHRVFGEIISPNTILPEWAIDGISHLLYEHYELRRVSDPMAEAVFAASAIPDLDKVSNHPEIWPGRFSYRIYGRPFIRWLYERYGWERLLLFLQLHGRGILPLEIDIKASRVFGQSWSRLWQIFQARHIPLSFDEHGISIEGYWDPPYRYWNETGVFPGILENARRGRYGFVDQDNWLWLSEYGPDGTSRLRLERFSTKHAAVPKHVWDPGPGSIAVGRRGSQPVLIQFGPRNAATIFSEIIEDISIQNEIPAPPGVLQMSGPVMDEDGRIAVAANTKGNWDIWLYNAAWYRVTNSPSIEMDPWWIGDKLVFSSNAGGGFQIYDTRMRPLTQAALAAVMPRSTTYLDLGGSGFSRRSLPVAQIGSLSDGLEAVPPWAAAPLEEEKGVVYSAWKSIWSNYLVPDYFINSDNQQLGVATKGQDVSRTYAWDAGVRHSFDQGDTSWRLGYKAKEFSSRATRYPFGYTTLRDSRVDETRLDLNLAWSPITLKPLQLSVNRREYTPERHDQPTRELWWGNIQWNDNVGPVRALVNLDIFNDDSQSFYGEFLLTSGRRINTIVRFRGGKTWGELNAGHNSFRIGGNSGEGFFTRRAARLFPLRGFDSDILDAGQAAAFSLDLVVPVIKLQTGYKTLPLFVHNIHLGGFVDTGFAAEHFDGHELLVSAGFELVTGMELAWDIMSRFSVGLAWPLKQPRDLHQSGPVLLLQLGRPL